MVPMGKNSHRQVPKNKQRYGQRGWERLSNAHPIDTRSCSVYKEVGEISEIDGDDGSRMILEYPAGFSRLQKTNWKDPPFLVGKSTINVINVGEGRYCGWLRNPAPVEK